MNILIVEDEILIQKSLVKLLQKRGMVAEGTSLAKQAIELILEKDYDRVVCDLMLQDLTGFDIIEASKKKYNKAEIAKLFVIMTAYSSPQILEKAEKYGTTVLQKPFDKVNRVIDIIIKGAEI